MLVRPGTNSEPAIVRNIDHPARPLAGRHRGSGKDRFVTDQWQHFWRAGNVHWASAITGEKAADYLGQLHQTQPLEQLLERQILAKRNKMHLVVYTAYGPVRVNHVDRVVRALVAWVGIRSCSNCARYQYR